LAERLYESARMQYERGYISSLELRDAQLGLSAARLAQLQSMYGYRQALIDLQDAVGVDRLLNEET
jgi:outer membrane protein TolC